MVEKIRNRKRVEKYLVRALVRLWGEKLKQMLILWVFDVVCVYWKIQQWKNIIWENANDIVFIEVLPMGWSSRLFKHDKQEKGRCVAFSIQHFTQKKMCDDLVRCSNMIKISLPAMKQLQTSPIQLSFQILTTNKWEVWTCLLKWVQATISFFIALWPF